MSIEEQNPVDNDTVGQQADAVDENAEVEREASLVEEYLKGLPRLSIGALLMPPVWGPARGMWVTILWYPLWVFADNCLFAWWSLGTPLATIVGIATLILMLAATVGFAVFSTPYSALRFIRRGKTKEEYQRSERIWAVVSVVLAIVFLGFATYYNLAIRTPLAG